MKVLAERFRCGNKKLSIASACINCGYFSLGERQKSSENGACLLCSLPLRVLIQIEDDAICILRRIQYLVGRKQLQFVEPWPPAAMQ